MVIRGSRKLLIKQLDTSLIQENFLGARRRDAHQIGPRVMVFDADRVFAHGILQGDLGSLPYKTVCYVLSSLRVINKLSNAGLGLSVICGSV